MSKSLYIQKNAEVYTLCLRRPRAAGEWPEHTELMEVSEDQARGLVRSGAVIDGSGDDLAENVVGIIEEVTITPIFDANTVNIRYGITSFVPTVMTAAAFEYVPTISDGNRSISVKDLIDAVEKVKANGP